MKNVWRWIGIYETPPVKPTISYPAELEVVFLLNDVPCEVIIFWKVYDDQRNQIRLVPYADIMFNDQLGRGIRRRQKPDRLCPELNVTHSTKLQKKLAANENYKDIKTSY